MPFNFRQLDTGEFQLVDTNTGTIAFSVTAAGVLTIPKPVLFFATAATIADVVVTGVYADDDNAIAAAVNAIIAALEAAQVVANNAIADISATGTYATDDGPLETAVNAIIDAIVAVRIVASGAIADLALTGTYATDDTPIETAINSIKDALVTANIVAAA